MFCEQLLTTTDMRTLLLSILGATALACSSSNPTVGPSSRVENFPAPLGEPFDIALGQTATVGSTGLRIGFRAVNNDSRCATDVVCVWQGDAELELPLDHAGHRAVALLHTTLDPRKLEYEGYDIEVVGLRPDNHSRTPIPQSHYIATVRVTSR